MKEIISTTNAPGAIGPYSQATKIGNMIFASGQIPINPATGNVDSNDIVGQTHQALKNVGAILESQGLNYNNIVKTTVFLKDMNSFASMNEVYSQYFEEGNYPARSAVEVARLPKDVLVEIEFIASK